MTNTLLINDHPVYYDVIGKGNPVMLVHGFGEDSTIWENQVEVLKNNWQLIIPDLPGSGRSALTEDVSMEGMADILKRILDELQVSACIMIGHSMGGYITLAFADKYPGMLKAFGLFHSTAYADNEEKIAARRRGIAFIEENGAAKFMEQSTLNLFSKETKEKRPDYVQEIVARYTNFLPQSLVSYYEAMIQRPNRTNVLQTFKMPVLFILGMYDSAIPVEHGLEQCHMPGLSYIHILRHSGHLGMLEESTKSTGFLVKFLQDNEIG
jgi:pimeloyl-ACP methyl ester carboxylesterase